MLKRKLLTIIIGLTLLTIFPISSAFDNKQIIIERLYSSEEPNINEHSENRATIYYADASVGYSKSKTGPYISINKHIHVHSSGTYHSFDADLEEFVLEIVVNYTAEMNFTAGFPYVIFAPIIAFGLKIEKFSDYVWQSFKLKHDGYAKREGNVSVEIHFDMDNIESGDKIILDPTLAIVGDPLVYTSKDLQFSKYTSLLLRFAYHLPSSNKLLLNRWILPFIAENNWSGTYGDFTKIYILFE